MSSVRADALLAKLDELWTTLGKEDGGDQSEGVLRACAMTLIVCVDGEDAALGETLAMLVRDHPARLVVLHLIQSAEPVLTADVVPQCWRPVPGSQQICCELIEIRMTESRAADVAPVVRGLIAPDLPVAIWCRSRSLVAHAGLAPVLRLANKLIVDSQGVPGLAGQIALIRAVSDRDTRVADLAWTRLTRWREAVAAIFDSPAYLEHLPGLRRVLIDYEGDYRPMSTCYLPAWLAHCLGRDDIEVEWRRAGHCPRARLSRVALHGETLDVAVRVDQSRAVALHAGQRDTHSVFPMLSEYEVMREELMLRGEDPVFEGVLRRASEFA